MSEGLPAARPPSQREKAANLAICWLLVGLAFVLPLYRNLVSALAPALILLWLFDGPLRRKLRVVMRIGPATAVLLFIALNLLSLLWSHNPAEGFDYLGKYRYFLLIPVIATSLRPQFIDRVVTAFLGGLTVSLVWSYGLFFGWVHFGKGYPENAAPTMLHLDYSMFLAFGALLVLNRIVRRPMRIAPRLLWIGLLAFLTGGIFINIGRSGQVAFVGTLLVILLTSLPGRALIRLPLALATVVAVVVIAYLAAPVFHTRVDSAVDEIRSALVDHRYQTNQGKRIAGMKVAARIFLEHPLLGTGVGENMEDFHLLLEEEEYSYLRSAVQHYRHMHNQYVQIATELGLVGLLALLNIFFQLLRVPVRTREMRGLAVVLGCVFLFGFIGDPFFHKQLPLVLFSVMAGLIASEAGTLWWPDQQQCPPADTAG